MHRYSVSSLPWPRAALLLLIAAVLLISCRKAPADEQLPPLTAEAPAETTAPDPATPTPTTAAQESDPATEEPSPATPTLPPAPTSTPFPEGQLDRLARQLAYEGRFEQLIAAAQAAPDEAQRLGPDAMAALATAYASEDQPAEAIVILEKLLEAYPDSASAWGGLGDLYARVGENGRAADAYRRLAETAPETAPYARFKAASVLLETGDHAGAADELASADLTSLPASRRAEALELLAQAYRGQGAHDAALATYDRILAFAQLPDYQALLRYYRAITYLEAGQVDDARPILRTVARERPQSYAAFLALERLIELGDLDLSPLEHAAILFHAREHLRAAAAADRALDSGLDAATALFWKGQAYAALGRFAEAIDLFDQIIAQQADHALAGDAWMAKASSAASLGGDPVGIYHEFVRNYPDHPRAPEALWRSAVHWERNERWSLAREYYQRLVDEYPADSRVTEARFRVGLSAYALGEWQAASEAWYTALGSAPAAERPRLHTWIGLTQDRLGAREAADQAWSAAVEALPWGYHGLRARDFRESFDAESTVVTQPPPTLTPAEWSGLRDWAESWWQPPQGYASSHAPEHPLVRRASAAWHAGWRIWARETLALVRVELKDDPVALVDLAQHAEQLGMYDQVIAIAERLLWLAREAGQEPVREVWRLAYPTYYAEMLWEVCEGTRVDPLLFLALIRQESRFNPDAVSWAGATGLTQVMPTTGEWIAEQAGPRPFRRALLTRPHVSLMQGVWYLNNLLRMYDNDWIAALVGYNAGSGNLGRWTGGEPITDHDLFRETIPITEPKDYIRLIYEGYRIYQHIYGEASVH